MAVDEAARASTSGVDQLEGEQVLELTLFAKKKAWIDAKIQVTFPSLPSLSFVCSPLLADEQFLSALAPIEVITPPAPARSSTTHQILERWWAEHDRIESEVDAYDMGDLSKMRTVATNKSKQELSPKDTDLIEVCLTTPSAVDKLLHLLRQRREALILLGHRLQSEESVAAAWASHGQLESDAEALTRDTDAALLQLPARALAEGLERRARKLRNEVDNARRDLAAQGPTHPLAPEQADETARLAKTLEKNLGTVDEAVVRAEKRVERYERGVEALERAAEVRTRLEAALGRLREFEEGWKEIERESPRGPEEGERCLERTEGEEAWEKAFDALGEGVGEALQEAGKGARDAADVVVDLGNAGVDPNVRRGLKDLARGVEEARRRVAGVLEREDARRRSVEAARKLERAVRQGRERVEEARRKLRDEAERVRWKEASRVDEQPTTDFVDLLAHLQIDVDSALDEPLRTATSLLQPAHFLLHDHLTALVSSLRDDLHSLHDLRSDVDQVRHQTAAVQSFTDELAAVEAPLQAASASADDALGRELLSLSDCEFDMRQWRLDGAIRASAPKLFPLVSNAHLRIPFLASSSPPTTSSLPYNLMEHDSLIRAFLHRCTSRTSGELDEARQKERLLFHCVEARDWDRSATWVNRRLYHLDGELEEVEKAVDWNDDAQTTLDSVWSPFSTLCRTSDTISEAIAELLSSLDSLRSDPSSSFPAFNGHSERQSELDILRSDYSTLTASINAVEELFGRQRVRREELLRAWEGRRDEVVAALEAHKVTAETLQAEVSEAAKRLTAAADGARAERAALLQSAALDLSADVDLAFHAAAIDAASSARRRIEDVEAALVEQSDRVDALEAALPSLHFANADLSPASSAHTAAQTASASASSSVTEFVQLIQQIAAKTDAFIAARADWTAELERRRREEETAQLAAASETSAKELAERIETDCTAVEMFEEEARQAVEEAQGKSITVAKQREGLLQAPDLDEASEADASVSGLVTIFEDLQRRVRALNERKAPHEATLDELAAATPATSAAASLDSVRLSLSSLRAALAGASTALDDLAHHLDLAQINSTVWTGARAAVLAQRGATAALPQQSPPSAFPDGIMSPSISLTTPDAPPPLSFPVHLQLPSKKEADAIRKPVEDVKHQLDDLEAKPSDGMAVDEAARASGRAVDELDGEQVLELTLFAEKKAWIDAKIQFLSALAPIEVITPPAPARSSTTHQILERWWAEHDRIESEVDAYDMGDLSKMRTVAKNKSKQELSPKDTDLIEVCLTTLFAVDKLLHLLRQRRKALILLGYRLQWEESVATAWASHRQLLADLPTFLAKSRWSIPLAISSPSRHPSGEPPAGLPTSSSQTSLLSASTSLSTSTSSRRLSFIASPNTAASFPSPGLASASQMSRTMRSQMLSLSLSSLHSSLRLLTSSLLPSSSTHLDKLIDTSPSPLPDSFLDAQDALEDTIRRSTAGLGSFAEEMVRLWKTADEVFWRAHEAEGDAEALTRDTDEALLKLPARAHAEAFKRRARKLRNEVEDTREALARRDLPSKGPTHPLAPEQAGETARLAKTLEKNLGMAEEAVARAEKRVERYERGVEALERAAEVRTRLEAALGRLRGFEEGWEGIEGGRPRGPEEGETCLERTEGEEAWEKTFDALDEGVGQALEEARKGARDAADVVVDLGNAGVDPNVRRGLKDLARGVEEARRRVAGVLEREDARRRSVEAARKLERAVGQGRERVEEARRKLRDEAERVRWKEASRTDERPTTDFVDLLAHLQVDVDSALDEPLRTATSLLQPAHFLLHDHLTALVSSLHDDLHSLHDLRSVVDQVQHQTAAVQSFTDELAAVEAPLQAASASADDALAQERTGWSDGSLASRRRDLKSAIEASAAQLFPLVSDAHLRIPFLASSSPPPTSSLPYDLKEHDALIRAYINRSTSRASGELEEARKNLQFVMDLEEAFCWDEEAEKVGRDIEELDRGVEGIEKAVADRNDDAQTTFDSWSSTLSTLSTASSNLSEALTGLSISLDTIRSYPSSSFPPFNGHAKRQSFFDVLLSSRSALAARITAVEEQLARSRVGREERLRAWERRRDGVAATLEAQKVAAEALQAEVSEAAKRLTAAADGARAERAALLQSAALDLSADVDLAFHAAAIDAASSARRRIEDAGAALVEQSAHVDTLGAALPTLHSPSADLSPANSALTAAQTASAAATSSLDELDQLILQIAAETDAFIADRAAELERRRQEEETAQLAAAWETSVKELEEQIEANCMAVESVAEEAKRAVEEAQEKSATVAKEREELLQAPDLSEASEVDASSASVSGLVAVSEDLQRRLLALNARKAQHEATLDELSAATPATSSPGSLDSPRSSLSSLQSASAAASTAIDDLAHHLDLAETESTVWTGTRAAVLAQRQATAALYQQSPPSAFPDGIMSPSISLTTPDSPRSPSFPVQGLRRSQASISITSPLGEEVDVFGPASPSSLFALSPTIEEPPEVIELRSKTSSIVAHEWLDSEKFLQLPPKEEAEAIQKQVEDVKRQLDELEANPSDGLVWTDLTPLKTALQTKEEAARRVAALAHFAVKVDAADVALSNLLDAIDAVTPGLPPPSPTDSETPPRPLSDAIVQASDAVTAVRVEAIQLVDDRRVEQAIDRIEGSWAEMMAMVDDVRPRAGSAASSASSSRRSSRTPSRTSSRTPSRQPSSRPMSRTSSSSSVVSHHLPSSHQSLPSRPSSAASSTRSSRSASIRDAPRPGSTWSLLDTPRKATSGLETPTATPRRRVHSALPVATPRRNPSPRPPPTPTTARPFSFTSASKRDLAKSTSAIPRRSPAPTRQDSSASLAASVTSNAAMRRFPSASSTVSSRRDSLASSVSSRRSSYETSSRYDVTSPHRSPRLGGSRSTPPRPKQLYRPNMDNKLDREVGNIINALGNIHVPIEVAEGRWTDESGMYLIGSKPYFCRILRSKQVMVRVGGGWQNLLKFVISHFGLAAGLALSPPSSVKSSISGEPQWISASSVRNQLATSDSAASFRDYLSSSVSSGSANTDLSLSVSTSSLSMRRSLSSSGGTPLRRSFTGNNLIASPLSPGTKHIPKARPALPVWRP
ncbi:hypothetical protein JCM1840_005942 [Sporobolomyces johnsonii]